MTYDRNIARLREIVDKLESDEPVSLEEYKNLATEARALVAACRKQLTEIEAETASLFEEK